MKHFEDFNDGKKIFLKSDYVRSLIFAYINNPRYKREEILFFEENFKILREAISKNKRSYLNILKKLGKLTLIL